MLTKLFAALFLVMHFATSSSSVSAQDSAQFTLLRSGTSRTIVVFVHGLCGDPKTSFTNSEGTSWPSLMASDTTVLAQEPPLSSHSISVVGYRSPTPSLTIPQISDKIIAALADGGVFSNYDSVVIVAHSLGGILIKDALIHAKIRPRDYLAKIKAVFLIAVPSQGSGTANVAAWFPSACKEGLSVLVNVEFNPYLQAIDRGWDEFMRSRGSNPLKVFCAYESRPFILGITPVPQSATKTSCDDHSWAVEAHHFNIVRPAHIRADVHTWVRRNVAFLTSNIAEVDSAAAAAEIARAQQFPRHVEQLKIETYQMMEFVASLRLKCRTGAVLTQRGRETLDKVVAGITDKAFTDVRDMLMRNFGIGDLRLILAHVRASQPMYRVMRAAVPAAFKSPKDARVMTPEMEKRAASAVMLWNLSRGDDTTEIVVLESLKLIQELPGLTPEVRAEGSKIAQKRRLTAKDAVVSAMVDHASLEELDRSVQFLDSPLGHKYTNASIRELKAAMGGYRALLLRAADVTGSGRDVACA